MIVKCQSKQYTIELSEISPATVGSLKAKLKEVVKEINNVEETGYFILFNKVKLTASDDTKLDDSKVMLNNDSTIYIILTSKPASAQESSKQGSASATDESKKSNIKAPYNNGQQPNMGNPNMFGMPQMNSPLFGQTDMNSPNMMNFNQQIMNQIISNPDYYLQMIESLPLPADQKAMMVQQLEMIKQNPQMFQQIMDNPALMNMMNSQRPGFNPYMNGMNPAMSPHMNPAMSPHMNPAMSPHMNPYYYNQMMPNLYSPMTPNMSMPHMHNNATSIPCSHGFYPLKGYDAKGNPIQQDADDVYASQLKQLNEMGFMNKDENVKALIQAKGDINAAIDILSKKL